MIGGVEASDEDRRNGRLASDTPDAIVAGGIDGRLREAGLAGLTEMHVHPVADDEELAWLKPEGDLVWVEDLASETPRRGHGRRAMAELCMLADEEGCRIGLNPWAQTMLQPDALRQDELERFYQSLGFGWRRDHVMVREPGAATVVDVRRDVSYLPLPNRVELVLDATQPRDDLTRTSFAVPILDDGCVLMADNRRRGLEISGGHVEPGETQEEAAAREAEEETGATVVDLVPVAHLRMVSTGDVPTDWRYPHPLSYQAFFAGRVASRRDYVENDECLAPRPVRDEGDLKPHVALILRRARWAIGARRAAD